jgi:hypothetical protein
MTYFSTLLAGGERKCNKSLKNELLIFKLEMKNKNNVVIAILYKLHLHYNLYKI